MGFHAAVITPSGKVFDGEINALKAPGSEGDFGILSAHAPFLASLKSGVLKITQPEQEIFFAVAAGVLEVNREHNVLVLCDRALGCENFSEAKKSVEEFEKK